MSDEAARQAIERDLDQTIFVDAGAGSGKTRELVERIVRLVADEKAPLSSIAAITFTDAAAAELRDRVRAALQQAAERVERYQSLTDGQAASCRRGLDSIDSAPIQTLHSFAQRILALYPLEAGLPPRVEALAEIEASLQFQDEWSRFRERLYGDGCGNEIVAEAVRRGIALGLREGRLRTVALRLHAAWHRLRGWEPRKTDGPAINLSPIVANIEEALRLVAGVAV